MDRVRTRSRRAASSSRSIERYVSAGDPGPSDTRAVHAARVERAGIGLGIDAHGLDPHLARRPRHAHGDLAAVGDQEPGIMGRALECSFCYFARPRSPDSHALQRP